MAEILDKSNQRLGDSGKTKFICQECNMTLRCDIALQRHIKTKHLENRHKCKICNEKFDMEQSLDNHIKVHDGTSKLLKCMYRGCQKTFKYSHHHRVHREAHLKRAKVKPKVRKLCKLCQKWVVRLEQHINTTHSKAGSVLCNFCGEPFKSKNGRDYHELNIHKKARQFTCKLGGKSFSANQQLCTHKKTHETRKAANYKCEWRDCLEVFTTSRHFKQHAREHKLTLFRTCHLPASRQGVILIHKMQNKRVVLTLKHRGSKSSSKYKAITIQLGNSRLFTDIVPRDDRESAKNKTRNQRVDNAPDSDLKSVVKAKKVKNMVIYINSVGTIVTLLEVFALMELGTSKFISTTNAFIHEITQKQGDLDFLQTSFFQDDKKDNRFKFRPGVDVRDKLCGRVFLMPAFHYDDNTFVDGHLFLIVIDLRHIKLPRAYIYDTGLENDNTLEDVTRPNLNRMFQKMGLTKVKTSYVLLKWQVQKRQKEPLNAKMYGCGIYTCYIADLFVKYFTLDKTFDSMTQLIKGKELGSLDVVGFAQTIFDTIVEKSIVKSVVPYIPKKTLCPVCGYAGNISLEDHVKKKHIVKSYKEIECTCLNKKRSKRLQAKEANGKLRKVEKQDCKCTIY